MTCLFQKLFICFGILDVARLTGFCCQKSDIGFIKFNWILSCAVCNLTSLFLSKIPGILLVCKLRKVRSEKASSEMWKVLLNWQKWFLLFYKKIIQILQSALTNFFFERKIPTSVLKMLCNNFCLNWHTVCI